MKKVKPRNEIDKFMLRNIDIFIKFLNERTKRKLDRGILVGHCDFHKWNLLFVNDKLNGILDFENVEYGPRIKDFFFDPDNFENTFLFIKEYVKHNKLTKLEIRNLSSQKLLGNCYTFRWAYRGYMKNKKIRMMHLKYTIKKVNKYLDFEEKLKKRFK